MSLVRAYQNRHRFKLNLGNFAAKTKNFSPKSLKVRQIDCKKKSFVVQS